MGYFFAPIQRTYSTYGCLALLYYKMSSALLNKRIAGKGRIWTRYTTYFLDQLNARSCTFLDFMHCHFHSLEAGFDFLPIFGQMSSFDRRSTGLTLRRSKLYFYKIVLLKLPVVLTICSETIKMTI